MARIVGVGDCALSASQGETIITYALASCIAVTAHSPSKKAAGMVHILLPSSMQNQDNNSGPYYYATTGVPLMINRICSEYGCSKSELRVRLFGGADSIRQDDIFRLGQKNTRMVEKVLESMDIAYDATETGGFISRTLVMDVATGKIMIKSQPIYI